jgi:flagellin-like protein
MRYTETTKDDSAVSPVIGVILMVAITVILAAVIGTFVLGLGEQVEQNARAGVNADVDNSADTVTLSLTTLDNSDYVVVRDSGGIAFNGSVDLGSGNIAYMDTTGATIELDGSSGVSGTLTVVAVIGEAPRGGALDGSGDVTGASVPDSATQTTVQQVEYDLG